MNTYYVDQLIWCPLKQGANAGLLLFRQKIVGIERLFNLFKVIVLIQAALGIELGCLAPEFLVLSTIIPCPLHPASTPISSLVSEEQRFPGLVWKSSHFFLNLLQASIHIRLPIWLPGFLTSCSAFSECYLSFLFPSIHRTPGVYWYHFV